ncbi:MAG: GNAT family N-acetyltransferase [Treponema sp.]|nr:GNAT family N-acetyltransferase [Treponema sp.]
MVYSKEIKGHFVTLRSITLDDAEFSYNLRKDPRFVSIMGQPAATIEDQRKFIEWQMKQPGDYYFVVFNNEGERIGLIGVYDVKDDSCEVGREINIGAPYETMEAQLLINDFILDVLKLKYKCSVIYKHNKKQLEMQRQKGIVSIGEVVRSGVSSFAFKTLAEDEKKNFDKVRAIIEKLAAKRGR